MTNPRLTLQRLLDCSRKLRQSAEAAGYVTQDAELVELWAEQHAEDAEKIVAGIDEGLFRRFRAILLFFDTRWKDKPQYQQAFRAVFELHQQRAQYFSGPLPDINDVLLWPGLPHAEIATDLFERISNYHAHAADAEWLAANRNNYIDALTVPTNPRAKFLGYMLYLIETAFKPYIHAHILDPGHYHEFVQGWLIEPLEEVMVDVSLRLTNGHPHALLVLELMYATGKPESLNWITGEQMLRVKEAVG